MSTTPFLGCKISLISKSEIRYEGILYTIDSKESTITLAKVKSYGTETRQAERQVPPRDEEFEYIIFRANDIKDLIVDDPPNTIAPGLADPAIIQAHSTSTTQASSASSSFPSGSIGAAMNSASSNLSSGVANQARPFQSGLSSTVQGNSNQSVFSAPTHVGGVPVSYTGAKAGSIGSGSRNSSPLGRTRGRKASGSRSRRNSGSKSGRSTPKDAFSQFREPQSQQNKREGGGQLNRRDGQQQDQHQRGNRTRGAQSAGGQQRQPRGGQTGQQNYQQQNYQQRNQAWGQQSGYNNRGFGRQDGQHGGRQGGQYGRSGDYQDRNRQYGQNDRWGQSGQQQGYQRRGPPPFRQNPNAHQPRTNSTSQAGAPKPKETLKFEGEFDFEKSNLEFSELVKNVGDLKIGEDGKAEGETANGEATSTQPKDDHQAGFTGSEAGDKEEDIFYDKTKSFFDSISCEASEREKGTGQRVDWKKERKTNSETFGQMPFNSWRRPGYRPRGGGYGYGYGYGNRGRFQSRGGGYGQGFRPSGGSRDGGHGSGERRSFSNNGPKPQMAK